MFFFYNSKLKITKLIFISYLYINKIIIINIKLFF